MNWINQLFSRRQLNADLSAEIQEHLAEKVEELMASGMSREEATYAARREFGNVLQIEERSREVWQWPALENFFMDIRFGARQLRRNPGFTAVAVFTLALGIGANVAVFSLLETVLLRALPYPYTQRLYRFYPYRKNPQNAISQTSYPNLRDWQQQSRAFDAIAGYYEDSFNLTGRAEPERLEGLRSTPGLFALLGISPVLGREFGPGDDPHVVLLTYEIWRRRFGSEAGIIGQPIHLDGETYTVLGVLPPHFRFPPSRWGGAPDLFAPAVPNPGRGWHYLRVIGRLAPGATDQQARAEMDGIAARLAKAYPDSNHDEGVVLEQLTHSVVAGSRQTMWVLLGAVAFVLLIACSNVANLLLSQGARREREIAIRTAVGATRTRLVRQMLTENLLLAGTGSALGVALAYWLLPMVASSLPQHSSFFTRVQDAGFELNSTVLIFAGLVALLSCALFGLLPAWRATEPARSSGAGVQAGHIRGALIGLEVGLSFVLLAGAGLMMRSLVLLLETDVGFRTDRLLTMDISLSGTKYSLPENQAAFYTQVIRRLESLPSVISAGAITDLPMTGSATYNGFEIPGPHPREGLANDHSVSPDYFRTMGIPLLGGRGLLATDSAHAPLVGVINRTMARKYWPHENPIGKTIIAVHVVVVSTWPVEKDEIRRQELEVVGIVGDVRQLGLDDQPHSELFIPYTQWPSDEMSLVLRTAAQPSALIPTVKKETWRVDPNQPITDVKTMDELVSIDAAGRRFVLELLGVFAAIALVLAAVGIYGVIAYATRQRTHEIGIRMALGARGQQILWLVAGQSAPWVLIGIVAGVGSALALTRLLAAYLYAVRATDPLTFVAVSLLLTAVALTAVYIPARRAMKVDPMVALRYE